MRKILALLFLTAIFISVGVAQPLFPSQSMSTSGDTMTATFRGPANLRMLVTGAPYSADQVNEHTQTLADGTHINQNNNTQHLFRDSQGRTRTERPFGPQMATPMGQSGPALTVIEIADPVAQVAYLLDEQNKVAHRVPLNVGPPVRVPGAARALPPPPVAGPAGGGGGRVSMATGGVVMPGQQAVRPENSNDKLGTQTIEGVVAEGTRHTTTWPIGSQGNDRPMTDVSETWYSAELKMTVLSKYSSARNGDNVTRLINISRAEPNPTLFQPPPEYSVVDDKDSVTMTLTRQ
jgi:hypothetical protein